MFRKIIAMFIVALVAACGGKSQLSGPTDTTSSFDAELMKQNMWTDMTGESASGIKTIAALLPLSGPNASLGLGIQHAIEIAMYQKQSDNTLLSFHDVGTSGTEKHKNIQTALNQRPDLIIGPLFADDVSLVRDMADSDIPILSFTSDSRVLGNNVHTMALMPSQQVSSVIAASSIQNKRDLVIIAPDNTSGYIMANAALDSAKHNGMHVAGLYYYPENNPQKLRDTAKLVAHYDERNSTNNSAKTIISNILVQNESKLTLAESESLNNQLDKLKKSDTLGDVNYDSILLLGSNSDLRSLGSYLRYYDVRSSSVQFLGTALLDSPDMYTDPAFSGAIFATLPAESEYFKTTYSNIETTEPTRLASMGYDATNIALSVLFDSNPNYALSKSSGFSGIDGIVRFLSDGTSERGLRIMKMTGSQPREIVPAPRSFLDDNPINASSSKPSAIKLNKLNLRARDFITIPSRFSGMAKTTSEPTITVTETVSEILPEDDSGTIIDSEYMPGNIESVETEILDSVEIIEKPTTKKQ